MASRDRASAGSNLILIGPPAAGKSTLGVLLAKRLSLDFVDTDVVLQVRQGRRLQDILDALGASGFRRLEEEAILSLAPERTVIATGGSVIYSQRSMELLRRLGRVLYLDLPLGEWRRRLRDLDTRGVVRAAGQSLDSLYAERRPLYLRWADAVIDLSHLGHDEAVDRLAAAARS